MGNSNKPEKTTDSSVEDMERKGNEALLYEEFVSHELNYSHHTSPTTQIPVAETFSDQISTTNKMTSTVNTSDHYEENEKNNNNSDTEALDKTTETSAKDVKITHNNEALLYEELSSHGMDYSDNIESIANILSSSEGISTNEMSSAPDQISTTTKISSTVTSANVENQKLSNMPLNHGMDNFNNMDSTEKLQEKDDITFQEELLKNSKIPESRRFTISMVNKLDKINTGTTTSSTTNIPDISSAVDTSSSSAGISATTRISGSATSAYDEHEIRSSKPDPIVEKTTEIPDSKGFSKGLANGKENINTETTTSSITKIPDISLILDISSSSPRTPRTITTRNSSRASLQENITTSSIIKIPNISLVLDKSSSSSGISTTTRFPSTKTLDMNKIKQINKNNLEETTEKSTEFFVKEKKGYNEALLYKEFLSHGRDYNMESAVNRKKYINVETTTYGSTKIVTSAESSVSLGPARISSTIASDESNDKNHVIFINKPKTTTKMSVKDIDIKSKNEALIYEDFMSHGMNYSDNKELTAHGIEKISVSTTTSSTTKFTVSAKSSSSTEPAKISSIFASHVSDKENQEILTNQPEATVDTTTEFSIKDMKTEIINEAFLHEEFLSNGNDYSINLESKSNGNKNMPEAKVDETSELSMNVEVESNNKASVYEASSNHLMDYSHIMTPTTKINEINNNIHKANYQELMKYKSNSDSILKKEVDSSELSTSSLGKQKQDNTSSVDDTIAKILEFIIFDKLQESDHSYSSEETTTGSLDSASTKYDQKSKISSLDQVNEQTVGPLPGSSTSSSSKKSSTIERFTDSSSENIKRKEMRKEFKEKDIKSYIPPKNHIKEDALASTFPSNMNEDLGKHTVEELNAHSGSSSNSPYKDIPQAERSENESSKQMKKGVNQNINLIEQTSIILPVIAFNDKLVNHKTTQSTISQQVINLEKSKESYIRPDTTTEVILVSTMDSPKASSASEETMIIYEESQQNGPSTKSNKKSTENLSEDLLRELASSFTLDELLSEEDNRDELNSKD